MRRPWIAVAAAAVTAATAWAAAPLRAAPPAATAVAVEAVTWVWTGPARHPLADQAADRQLVSYDQASATEAVTLLRLEGGSHRGVVLTVPATTDPLDGAVDAQGTAAVWACPVLGPWEVGEPGRPAGDIRWDCEIAAAKGVADADGDVVTWTFEVPEVGEHGIALAPASRTGAYVIPFVATDAKAIASLPLPGTVSPATDAAGAGTGPGALPGDPTATEGSFTADGAISFPPLDSAAAVSDATGAVGDASAPGRAGRSGTGGPGSGVSSTAVDVAAAAQLGDRTGQSVPAGMWLAVLALVGAAAATIAELRPRPSKTEEEDRP